jgi:multidrug efflux pump subunit AcrA (membrane-fusion protein)
MKSKALIALTLLSLLVTGCSTAGQATATPAPVTTVPADTRVMAEGRLEPVHHAEIAFSVGGVVSEVLVQDGQQVKKGQPLVRLASSESARAAVAQAQEALLAAERQFGSAEADALKALGDAYEAVRRAQINLDNYDIPSYLKDGTPAEGVEKMYAVLESARKAYEPYKYLGANSPTRKEQKKRLDDAWDRFNRAIRWAKLEAELKQAQRELDSAQADFTALAGGSQEGSLAQARYNTAQANLLAAQSALGNVELVSPFDGVIAGVDARAGSSINPGQVAVKVADFSSWLVKTTDLTEMDVISLTQGQPVIVTLDAIPTVELKGSVLSIGQSYAEHQGDVVYEITILLANTHPGMRWGMTAGVTFENQD